MRLLLDTLALLWFPLDDQKLKVTTRGLIGDPHYAMTVGELQTRPSRLSENPTPGAGDRKGYLGANTLTHKSVWSSAGFPRGGKKDPPEWLKETEEILRSFATLSEGWDSYGAKVIELQAVDSAIELLRRIVQPETPKPAVVPTNRGGIQIEWHTRGIDLEIEITAQGELRLLYVNPEENAEDEFEIGVDLKPLAELITKISPSR